MSKAKSEGKMGAPEKEAHKEGGKDKDKGDKRSERGSISKARAEKTQKANSKIEEKKSDKPAEKGILKKKKGRTGAEVKKKVERVKREKPKKKSAYEKFAASLGIYVGNVTLKDPRAIEAAQALDLTQSHLRKLRMKFDQIDIDGSGNIDYDEFFEAVGEVRSPFTDKLFSLIGELL